ncbi:MAG: TlpA disulfide reductase family protein [Bacteroidota bacterium]|nr:TlpA disulfide reductase family protein [Bacteroidota bacterium]
MKQLKFITFIFTLFVVFSCGERTQKDVIFSGIIKNSVSDSIIISSIVTPEIVQVIKLANDGTFADTFQINEGLYALSHGRNYTIAYFKPGFDFSIYINTENFYKTIKYKGKGAEENNLWTKTTLMQKRIGQLTPYTYYGTLNEKDFLIFADSVYNAEIEMTNNFEIKNKKFLNFVQYLLKIEKFSKISQYERIHQYLTEDSTFRVSVDYPKVEDNIDLNNEKMLIHPDYTYFVLNIYKNKIKNENSDTYHLDLINLIANEATNDSVKQELIYFVARSNIQHSNDINKFYNTFNKLVSYEKYKKEITDKYEQLLKVAPGKKSPDFNLENPDGEIISLADLAGKIVCINIWTTWNGPSMEEMHILEEQKIKFINDDIVFVSINMAEHINKWKAFVETLKMTSIQLRSETWDIDFIKEYMITEIPRFIIIDKEGYIIDNNAIKPSNPKFEEMLRELLDK